ncbi:MAG: aminotransferase class V-fold PLP-dependent enzyme [Oscillospiraceae bacterium]|jgi:cysteine desulfurase|nr:aminotransferase class V-fold PLP-dependent enzyme [Oscillospiraceae bacterium]
MEQQETIYFDNAATTQISGDVLDSMMFWLTKGYGNASSIYRLGREADTALAKARSDIAAALGVQSGEIFFTSGGSEGDNWAIKSLAKAGQAKGKNHIVTSLFEHHAVLHALDSLKKDGFEVTYLPVYENGTVRIADLEAAITDKTALVTIMYVNNEVGTIQPIEQIGAVCAAKNVPFHTDAVQAVGNLPIDIKKSRIGLMTVSGHKLHAQKGVGFLYADKRYKPAPLIDGGAQERGRRAGTENIAGIVGLAKAVVFATENVANKRAHIQPLADKLKHGVLSLGHVDLNGEGGERISGTLNFCIQGVEAESLLLSLDMKRIAASSGSACTSGSLDPSHVLLSMGIPHWKANGSLRLSLSEYTTEAEVDYFLQVFPPIVERLRENSPLWEKIVKEIPFK